jgi:hypothetical protein
MRGCGHSSRGRVLGLEWWCIPVIQAIQEANEGGSRLETNPRQKLEILCEK